MQKGCVFLCVDVEKPPQGAHQKVPAGGKCSILEADLGEKWLLCVIIAVRCTGVLKAASSPSLFVFEPLAFL